MADINARAHSRQLLNRTEKRRELFRIQPSRIFHKYERAIFDGLQLVVQFFGGALKVLRTPRHLQVVVQHKAINAA